MKKFLIFFGVMFLLCTGCSSNKLSGYDEISYNDFKKLVDNKESFPLVIGSSTCSACSVFKPTMESFIKKYQIDVRYIDLSKLSDEEKQGLNSSINFQSTPTTVFFEDGKQTSVYYRIVGSETLSNVINAYKKMGYIEG